MSPFLTRRSLTAHGCVLCFLGAGFVVQDIHSQGEVISCLEKALVKEAEQPDRVGTIKDECQKAILRVAELSSDDFHLDRHLYFSCRDDRERFCQNVRPPAERFPAKFPIVFQLCLLHMDAAVTLK